MNSVPRFSKMLKMPIKKVEFNNPNLSLRIQMNILLNFRKNSLRIKHCFAMKTYLKVTTLPFQMQMLRCMLPARSRSWWRWRSITRWLPEVSTCKLFSSKLKPVLAINCLKRSAGRGKWYIKWAEVRICNRKTKISKRSTTTWWESTGKRNVEIFSNSRRDHQRCLGRNLNRDMTKRKDKVQAIHIEANLSIWKSLTTNS